MAQHFGSSVFVQSCLSGTFSDEGHGHQLSELSEAVDPLTLMQWFSKWGADHLWGATVGKVSVD